MLNDFYASSLTSLLFEESDDFIAIFDLSEGKYVRVNQTGVHMLGYSSEQEILNDPVRSRSVRAQPLVDEGLAAVTGQLLRMGLYEENTQIERQNGQRFWGRVTISTFSAGENPYALVRIADQQKLHQTEQQLQHSIRRYESVFNHATIGMVVCNERGAIVSVNQMAAQQFGYPAGEMTTLLIEQLVPDGMSHGHQQLRQSFNTHPQVRAMGHNRDLNAQRKDGSVFPVEISLSYFQLEEALYVVAYIVDITAKKEAERQLLAHQDSIEKLNADLEVTVADRTHALLKTLQQLEVSREELNNALAAERQLSELKSRFVSMASHEFRTPLTAIVMSATLMGKFPDTEHQEKRQKYIDRILDSVNHLNGILEEFLSVGRLEEGKLKARPVETNVNELIHDAITHVQAMLKPRQVILPELACPAPIWLDGQLLRNILINLLSNAIKYSGAGAVVKISGQCRDKSLTLVVQDQGIGIASEDQAHLFERFFRAANASDVAGTGLGLHIVGRYVELMGGQVSLQSELNQGTTVTLLLPYETHFID